MRNFLLNMSYKYNFFSLSDNGWYMLCSLGNENNGQIRMGWKPHGVHWNNETEGFLTVITGGIFIVELCNKFIS